MNTIASTTSSLTKTGAVRVARALAALDALLTPQDIRWAVLGAHAANLYRDEVRATQDVDVLAALTVPKMTAFADDLAASGWQVRHRSTDGWLLRARHPELGDVDVMCVREPYQQTALSRSVEKAISGVGAVRFLAVEDVLIHKLIANRLRDELDVVSILKGSPALDAAHMEHWLQEWGIQERYDELCQRAADERRGCPALTASDG